MKIGRNDPCPCGSGRKYKKCCLAAAESGEPTERQERQPRLWADADDSAPDDQDDSPGDLHTEEMMRFDAKSVLRVTYSRGFADDEEDAYAGEGLASTVWTAPEIPTAVVECFDRERVEELEGEWGDPLSAAPIQVEQIDIETGDTVIGFEVFNRAVLLVFDNTEDTRRVHRVCSVLEQSAQEGHVEPGLPAEPRPSRVRRRREALSPVDFDALLKVHRNQGGACELCGDSLTRRGAARHLARCSPEHDVLTGPEQFLLHLKITASGAPAYWLDVEARSDAKLEALDRFLRNTWLECCGHLSQFRTNSADYFSGGYDFGLRGFPGLGSRRPERRMTARLGEVLSGVGDTVTYEYDFGSTTQLLIKVVDQRTGRIGRRGLRLIARNTPPAWPCERCGEPAVSVCASCWGGGEYGAVCRAHEGSHDCDGPSFLPAANSPRVGVCGYAGDEGY